MVNNSSFVILNLCSGRRWVSGQLQAPAASPPWKNPGTHWAGGWVGPRTGLDDSGDEKNLLSQQYLRPRLPNHWPVGIQTVLFWLPTLLWWFMYVVQHAFCLCKYYPSLPPDKLKNPPISTHGNGWMKNFCFQPRQKNLKMFTCLSFQCCGWQQWGGGDWVIEIWKKGKERRRKHGLLQETP